MVSGSGYNRPGEASSLSAAARIVRRNDPDRFLTTLFAPAPKRETLFVLYAFNHELARARAVVSEPMLALIRLQWWREVVQGARRHHEVAAPLGEALDAGELDAVQLASMIDAREVEAEAFIATFELWRDYLSGVAGTLAVAAGRVLDAPEPGGAARPGDGVWRRARAARGVGAGPAAAMHVAGGRVGAPRIDAHPLHRSPRRRPRKGGRGRAGA